MMCNGQKITRVDLKQHPTGIAVLQYPDGWSAGTNPIESHLNTSATLDEMVAWFVERGWTVRTWTGGARAYFGPLRPVRSKREILRMRSDLNRGVWWTAGHMPEGLQVHTLNLAYDL